MEGTAKFFSGNPHLSSLHHAHRVRSPAHRTSLGARLPTHRSESSQIRHAYSATVNLRVVESVSHEKWRSKIRGGGGWAPDLGKKRNNSPSIAGGTDGD
jgi:hypothetical protein